jgi:ribonuclease HI
MSIAANFQARRGQLQQRLQARATRNIKRLLSVDHACYQDGELPARHKELLGLTASLVLRCDDCIHYHLLNCHAAGWSAAEILEALEVALVVGGSIVIPHARRAVELLDELEAAAGRPPGNDDQRP